MADAQAARNAGAAQLRQTPSKPAAHTSTVPSRNAQTRTASQSKRAHDKERLRITGADAPRTQRSQRARSHHSGRIPFDGTCHLCKQRQLARFFCQDCISQRIDDHDHDRRRLGERRDKGAERVTTLLQPEATLEEPVVPHAAGTPLSPLNPFSDDRGEFFDQQPTSSVSRLLRTARGWHFQLQESLSRYKDAAQQSEQDIASLRKSVKERREALAKRRENLAAVEQLELAHDEDTVKSPGAWPVLRSLSSAEHPGLAARIERAKADLVELRERQRHLGPEITKTRRALVEDTLQIYNLQPPAGTLAREGRISGPIALRTQHAFTAPNAHSAARVGVRDARATSATDWTILDLVLPQPQDLHRFSLSEINAAVFHTAALQDQLSIVLGVMLPFEPIHSGKEGSFAIQPSRCWGGTGIEAGKHLLQLDERAYNTLVPKREAAAAAKDLGSSALDMAASAFEGAKSFIHIGSGYFPGTSSVMHGKPPPQHARLTGSDSGDEAAQKQDTREARAEGEEAPQTARKARKFDHERAIKSFKTALVMLAYNAAYLADTQGALPGSVPVGHYDDGRSSAPLAPSAVSVPLRLLRHLLGSKELGRRSHDACDAAMTISAFDFPRLDFKDLFAYCVPKSIKEENGKDEILMEGSYVDAKWDAASVILRDKKAGSPSAGTPPKPASASSKPSPLASAAPVRPAKSTTTSARPTVAGRQAPADGARKGDAPANLDFLRKRGAQVAAASSREAGTSSTKSASAAREIKVDGQQLLKSMRQPPVADTAPAESQKRKEPRGTVVFNGKPLS